MILTLKLTCDFLAHEVLGMPIEMCGESRFEKFKHACQSHNIWLDEKQHKEFNGICILF